MPTTTRAKHRSTLFPALSGTPRMRDVDLWDAEDGVVGGSARSVGVVPGDFVARPPAGLGESQSARGGSRERMMVSLQRWPAAANHSMAAEAGPSPRVSAADFKPRFLRRMEQRIDEAEAIVADGSELSEPAMELYRHTFQRLIEEFRTYGPVLSRIKAAYERKLQQCTSQIAAMEPKVAQLARVDSERDREIASATRSRDVEISKKNDELRNLRKQLHGFERLRRGHTALKDEHADALKKLANVKAELEYRSFGQEWGFESVREGREDEEAGEEEENMMH